MAMLKMTILHILIVILFSLVCAFENYVVYDVIAFNPHEREILYNLHEKNSSNVFMNGVSNEAALPMTVIVQTKAATTFENTLKAFGIQYITNSYISEEQKTGKTFTTSSPYNISKDFLSWENILKWISSQEKSGTFKKTVIAKTHESRDIFFLKLSESPMKPIVFILGGEDGFDWLSSAVILNLLEEFIEKSKLSELLNIFDFYLLPILNPDGFAYTKEKDRLWIKNRREIYPRKKCNDNFAIGVTIARNWLFQSFKAFEGECNSVYFGPKGLSEEETRSLSYVLNSLAQNTIAFINIRGFGRFITVPLKHTHPAHANNYEIVMEILKSTSYKVAKQNNVSRYYVGATSSLFYNFSGNIADWVKFKLNIPLVYTIYLEEANTIFPKPEHIQVLKKDFFIILNESLLLAYDIYGPLFNCQHILESSFYFNSISLYVLLLNH